MSYLQTQIENLLRLAQEQEQIEPYYETLEYVSLDGTQYFDTGYYGNTIKTSVDFDLSVDNFSNNSGICGSRNDATATENSMCILFLHAPLGSSARDALRLDWVGGGSSIFSNTLVQGARYNVTCTSNKGTVNDEVYTSTGTRNFDQTQTFLIGTVHSGNGVVFSPAMVGKIYVFKIFENGVLIYDYVPALDSQMRPCLYDKISKTFTYAKKISDGTTTYDLGFKRWNKFDVDYIQSSGTQYIDTGYAFADDFAYEVEYEGLNNGECLLGGRTSSIRTAILYRAMATQVDGQTTVPIAGLNATQTPFKLGVLSDTKHKVKVAIANNKGNVWIDDTQIYTDQSFTGTYISGKTTAIFADHFGDQTGTSEYQEYATSKLYALKFWQGTTLVRDYKPTVWHNGNTTAVACLYDEVYNKMYTNAGTGSFKAYVVSSNDTVYEVGTSMTTTKNGTSTVTTSVTSGCYIDLGIEANDVMIINGKTTTTSTGSNYYSGCRAKKPTGDTANPPILFAVSGSSTGSKVSATVNNTSGLAKSYNNNNVATDWERTGNYTYQLTISAYQKSNLTYFKAIGYSYTLGKEMIPIDETQAVCTITSGGETNTYNTIADVPDKYKSNILFGAIKVVDNGTGNSENNLLASNNTHYFYELYEQGQPIVRLLPVRNATNTSTIGMFNTVNRTFTQFTKVLVSNLTITYSFTALS